MRTSLAALALFVLTLSACSPGPEVPQIDATQGVEILAGTYTFTITAEDVAAFNSPDTETAGSVGLWTLVFSEDGKFEGTLDSRFIANGVYTVTNDQLQLGIDQVCEDCDCDNAIFRYYWLLEEDELRLAHIAGTCGAIEEIVTAKPLIRAP